ncbi:MAG: hypothetical protein ACI9W6_000438, partial [Motiliproteus sp.]
WLRAGSLCGNKTVNGIFSQPKKMGLDSQITSDLNRINYCRRRFTKPLSQQYLPFQ